MLIKKINSIKDNLDEIASAFPGGTDIHGCSYDYPDHEINETYKLLAEIKSELATTTDWDKRP